MQNNKMMNKPNLSNLVQQFNAGHCLYNIQQYVHTLGFNACKGAPKLQLVLHKGNWFSHVLLIRFRLPQWPGRPDFDPTKS